ncbi:hypothetical protein H0H87_005426 [Tephrocybe sp. NHM501043]|nr:hypothetical protein H0H87_005426 [Tephrocybe sp. NHM501043]
MYTMTSSASGAVTTLIGGIQNISALLPLLGTDQCEDHVSSAISRGYLYAAASSMSIFGSLGVARAGIKTLIASIVVPSWGFFGAEKLDDAGFKPAGKNASLILMDKGCRRRYLAETRFDALLAASQIEHLRVNDLNRFRFTATSFQWNARLFFVATVLGLLGILPYLQLNVHHDSNFLSPSTRWSFPLVRIVGSFLCATSMQVIIQRRLIAIMRKRLIFHALTNGRNHTFLETVLPDYWNLQTSSEQSLSQLDQLILKQGVPKARAYSVWLSQLSQLWDNFVGHCHKALLMLHRHRQPPPADVENIGDPTGIQPDLCSKQDDLQKKFLEVKAELDKAYELLQFGASNIWDYVAYLVLFLGSISTVTGYILSFSVVQRANPVFNSLGPVAWVILEAFLSVVRLVLWGWNPKSDDMEPLNILIDLDSAPPFPTCAKSKEVIMDTKFLPVVPASHFLSLIRFYAGQLQAFSQEGLSVFYTLTRASATWPQIDKHVLFITLVDFHSDKTVVYHEDLQGNSVLFSAESLHTTSQSPVSMSLVQICDPISFENFPTFNAPGLLSLLKVHYQDICTQLGRNRPNGVFVNRLQADWTLTRILANPLVNSVTSIFDDVERKDGSHEVQDISNKRSKKSVFFRTFDGNLLFSGPDIAKYLAFGALQGKQQRRFKARHSWLESYMKQVDITLQRQINNWCSQTGLTPFQSLYEVRVGALMVEFLNLEALLIYELELWENHVRKEYQNVLLSVKLYDHSETQSIIEWMDKDQSAHATQLVSAYHLSVQRIMEAGHKPALDTLPYDSLRWLMCQSHSKIVQEWEYLSQSGKHLLSVQPYKLCEDEVQEMSAPQELSKIAFWNFLKQEQESRILDELARIETAVKHPNYMMRLGDPQTLFQKSMWLPVVGPLPNMLSKPDETHAAGVSFAFQGLKVTTVLGKSCLQNNSMAPATCKIQFYAPMDGRDIVLALKHQINGAVGTMLNLELLVNDIFPLPKLKQMTRGEWKLFELHSARDLRPGWNVVTINIPRGIVYELQDISLLGPHQIPYLCNPRSMVKAAVEAKIPSSDEKDLNQVDLNEQREREPERQ